MNHITTEQKLLRSDLTYQKLERIRLGITFFFFSKVENPIHAFKKRKRGLEYTLNEDE